MDVLVKNKPEIFFWKTLSVWWTSRTFWQLFGGQSLRCIYLFERHPWSPVVTIFYRRCLLPMLLLYVIYLYVVLRYCSLMQPS